MEANEKKQPQWFSDPDEPSRPEPDRSSDKAFKGERKAPVQKNDRAPYFVR